jgi:hypothetical protein
LTETKQGYIKQVSKFIVDNIRGTENRPEASLGDFTKAIVRNTNEVLSVLIPIELLTVSKPIFVGIPIHLGRKLSTSLCNTSTRGEQNGIMDAGKKI